MRSNSTYRLDNGGDSSLYFHAPCFDGLASAVLASDFLETREDWKIRHFIGVGYESKDAWLSPTLAPRSAVVDFLYHPQAAFWADHHGTTFLTKAVRHDFEQNRRKTERRLIYNDQYTSCAKLLWDTLSQSFGYRNELYSELVVWADKIDGAKYASVHEAILGDSAALRVKATLSFSSDPNRFEYLIKQLRVLPLKEVAKSREVVQAAKDFRAEVKVGLKQFEKCAWLEPGDIVAFDVDGSNSMISRYAPYYVYPSARYSAGITRFEGGARLTAMRNPWLDFESVPLGTIFERFGGGGHQRVGALVLAADRAPEARSILDRILTEIRSRNTSGDHVRRSA
jgi:hypothetical protein